MPSLSRLINAHFQVIEIHQEVWLICEYRLAPLLQMKSCLLGSLWYSRFMNYLGQAGRTENELDGGGDRGVGLILGLLMNLIAANTRFYPGGSRTERVVCTKC